MLMWNEPNVNNVHNDNINNVHNVNVDVKFA